MSNRYLFHGSLLADALLALMIIAFSLLLLIHALSVWKASCTQIKEVDINELYEEGTWIYDD